MNTGWADNRTVALDFCKPGDDDDERKRMKMIVIMITVMMIIM